MQLMFLLGSRQNLPATLREANASRRIGGARGAVRAHVRARSLSGRPWER